MKYNRYSSTVIVVICLVISSWALANTNVTGLIGLAKYNVAGFFQDQERIILLAKPDKKDPLEITEIKIKESDEKEKAVRFGEKFIEDGQWLKKASFKIHNKYSKPITYVQINIDFPETEVTGIMMQHQLFLGQHPVFKKPLNAAPFQIMPGEFSEVSLASEYKEIKKMIELRNPSIEYISRILIRLSEVGFEDGTIYSGGEIFRHNPDPNGFPKWLKITE